MLQNNFESVNPKIETESLHDNPLYPAWCSDNGASVEIETIRSIFDRTALVFGFQADSSANMFEYLMALLDSRASRMSCTSALISVHADYLGGDSSSYKKWYFAAYYDLDRQYSDAKDIKRKWSQWARFSSGVIPNSPEFENDRSSFWGMDYAWRLQMSKYSEEELLEQLVLYLLIWGEANNLRFMPECIFFIYKCASDYLFCQEEKPAAPEFSFLNDIVTPIYLYIRDQQFDLKDGKLCRKRGLDHAQIIGYDDVNSFFWYPSNLEKLRIANDKTLHSIQKEHRYKELRNVQWKTVFQKTLNEKDGDFAITKIWNCIVISFYKEHLLSVEQVNKLIYQKETDDDKLTIGGFREPIFFNFQEDSASEKLSDFFASNAEASRRISFFARSLSSSLQAPIPIEGLPSFTVFAPHYSEKIILEIKELLKENEKSKISLLEYLKKLHPSEWRAFVKDTKLSKHVNSLSSLGTGTSWTLAPDEQAECSESRYTKWQNMQKYEDIPFDSIGFKNSQPESTIRTRIWASLRYQTLFRTISGFSNYEKALKILYYSENYNLEREFLIEPADLEDELDAFSRRKFRLLVSMQRYQHLKNEDLVATQLTAECFPNLHISYIETEETETGTCYYSVLLNSTNERAEESEDIRFRIKLSGDPKLGDGKSDNQNHSIIFHRGEYIQAIDSNQDNYIEECLKIKSVLAEFEELDLDPTFEYVPGMSHVTQKPRVAMVGAREYIFSENIGVLGDVSAGKEQTFGTLFARTLSKVNAKLHYGHPDFINSIFMFSRGGISKAQKGLHLNEDIYAGMNAVGRGGIVKHCDYYQCGKGRDLGFATILNFNTKIGAGMGEQTLSREVFYMGTRLHVDRFLSFYYAHAGFHLNNVFIILSVSLFLVILVFLGSLRYESILCITETASSTVEANFPYGCRNLVPVLEWMNRFVLSMFICFTISFLPITVQEITEKGVLNTLKRVTHHFFSLAPLFEVLVCKVYAKSFTENLRFGGAKYVATGRGFATERVKFHELYSKYADVSIYAGGFGLLVTIFATLTMWRPALFWFYLTSFALCFSPFIFNPHNFCLQEYILDYGFFLGWLFGGNHSSSDDTWVAFKKHQRAKYTGFKSNKRATSDSTIALSESSSSSANKLGEVGTLLFQALLFLLPYLYITAQSGVQEPVSVDPITRIAFLALLPIILNLIMLLILFPVSVVAGNLLTLCFKSSPSLFAGMSYTWGFLGLIICVNVTLLLHDWNVPRSLCAMICIMKIHTFLKTLTYNALLSKEYQDHQSNLAWWSGNWNIKRFGWAVLSQPFREILVKTCDLTSFGYDFVLGHFLFTAIFPVALVPLVDKAHTYILFWLKPSRIVHGPIYSKRQRKRRRRQSVLYSLLYLTVVSCSCAMVVVPAIFLRNFKIGQRAPEVFKPMFQPNHQNNNDTGPAFLASTPGVFALRTVQ
ncbi:putative 1,3-beta-glucan synthase [Clavispora lusitaniae]|uniref:1,3-beta-glucan synthase n=1 Tax=Clavispora lusitaniae TaxID=36911 RepID=A0AA91Q018_CLALS|nr:putative 1,3-beta-glucan synthase [Clavispora lusitaniae]